MQVGVLLEIVAAAGLAGFFAALIVVTVHIAINEPDQLSDGAFWAMIGRSSLIWIGSLGSLFVLSRVVMRLGAERLKRELLPVRCHRCPKCFYDLSTRPREQDICPECGVVAPRRECVRLWCRALRDLD